MVWRPDYITAAQLKSYLSIDAVDTVDDTELGRVATAASRAVDDWCNRQFGQATAATAITYRRAPYWQPRNGMFVLEIDDVQDTAGMLVAGVAVASSGAVLLPDRAALDGVPYTALGFATCPTMPLVITAKWGWNTVPPQVVEACEIQGQRWAARRGSPFGVAGSPATGSELRLLARLDVDAQTVLQGVARRRRAG
jgi:hypothetical protein